MDDSSDTESVIELDDARARVTGRVWELVWGPAWVGLLALV